MWKDLSEWTKNVKMLVSHLNGQAGMMHMLVSPELNRGLLGLDGQPGYPNQ